MDLIYSELSQTKFCLVGNREQTKRCCSTDEKGHAVRNLGNAARPINDSKFAQYSGSGSLFVRIQMMAVGARLGVAVGICIGFAAT